MACTDTLDNPCTCEESGACQVLDVSACDLTTRIFDPLTGTCQPKESRTIHFLHKDLQGSLRVATAEGGKVFQYVDYLPTGRPWVAGQNTTKDTPFLFAGGWTDMTYDLVNFGKRWYDAREENFLSPEPLLEEDPYAVVDDPSLLSAYTYAASNPLRFVDPDGRAPKVASKPFNVGDNSEKHQAGDISISVSQRKNRPSPKITFGGRYSNDAQGQALGDAFQKHADRAERFSTILSISTEDGVRKIRVFGITAKKTDVGPNPGPGKTGADGDSAQKAPPKPVTSPPQPDAKDTASQNTASGKAVTGAGDGSGADKSGGSGPTTPPPKTANDDNDGAKNQQTPPRQPNAGSSAAKGPDDPRG